MTRLEQLLRENQWSRPSPSLSSREYPFGIPTCPVCATPQARGGHNLECWLGQVLDEFAKEPDRVRELRSELEGKMEIANEAIYQLQLALDTLRQRTFESLGWMVTTFKYQHNETHGNVEKGSEGGYTPELTAAIELFTELGGT